MRALTKIFRREERYLALLEASADEAQRSVEELQALLKSVRPPSPDMLIATRQRTLAIDEKIEELLCQGANPPIDREDVEALARALSGIPRSLKRFAVRFTLCAEHVKGVAFDSQLGMLERAVETLGLMVGELRSPRLASAKRGHDTLQKIESDADRLYVRCITELCREKKDPLKAVMLRDLYELLEQPIDRCRTAGNIILRIVLKHT